MTGSHRHFRHPVNLHENRYEDYLYPHSLSLTKAEAFAEYLRKRIRGELGFAAEKAANPNAMLAQGYRGSRSSFGYPDSGS